MKRPSSKEQVAILVLPEEGPNLWISVHFVVIFSFETLVFLFSIRKFGTKKSSEKEIKVE